MTARAALEAAFRQAGWQAGVRDVVLAYVWLVAFAAYLDTLKR